MATHKVFLFASFLCVYLGIAEGLTCNVCTGTNGICSGTPTTCTSNKCYYTSRSDDGFYTSGCDPSGQLPVGCSTVGTVTNCVTDGITGPWVTCPVCQGMNGACSGTITTCTATKCVNMTTTAGAVSSNCDMTGKMPLGCTTVGIATSCVTDITSTKTTSNPAGSGARGSGNDKQSFCIIVLLASLTIGMII